MRKQFPFSRQHIGELVKMFETYDVDKSGTLDIEEMKQMLLDIDKKMTHYPAVSYKLAIYISAIHSELTHLII